MGEVRDFTPLELRFVPEAPEFRMAGNSGHITGYAASFNKLSRRLGGFHERIASDAFNESRDAGWPNVVCRYNHKPEFVLGTTQAGTCTINVDERGMHYDVDPPKSRGDVLELVQRGDVRYSSFAFRSNPENGDEWTEDRENGYPLRILHNVEVIDVAPVIDPAYFDTTASARNMAGVVESLSRHMHADPEEVRSMLEEGSIKRFFKRTDRPSEQRETAETSASATDTTEEDLVEATEAPKDEDRKNVDVAEDDAGVPETDAEDTAEDNEDTDERKALTAKSRDDLKDSDFAYIDSDGNRHLPIHDKTHVQKALQLGPQTSYWSKAKSKVLAAAKKHGIKSEEQNSLIIEGFETRAAKANFEDLDTCECGSKNQFGRHCTDCGKSMREMKSSDKFCSNCGSKIKPGMSHTGDMARSNEEPEDAETRDAEGAETAEESRSVVLPVDMLARNAAADARLAEMRRLLED